MTSATLVERVVPVEDKVFLSVVWISGLMFGLEIVWESRMVVLDLGIIRIFVGLYKEHK